MSVQWADGLFFVRQTRGRLEYNAMKSRSSGANLSRLRQVALFERTYFCYYKDKYWPQTCADKCKRAFLFLFNYKYFVVAVIAAIQNNIT